jgi:hypothetical protein
MHRITSITVAVALLATRLAAQAKPSITGTATSDLTVNASLTLTKQTDQHFGTHFPTEGSATTAGSATGAAQWTGTTDVANRLSITFTLPTTLVSGANTVAYSCGITSADISSGSNPNELFDPNKPYSEVTPFASTGAFNIAVGNNGAGAANGCTVVLTGAKPGVYTGAISVLVAVL